MLFEGRNEDEVKHRLYRRRSILIMWVKCVRKL